MVTICKEINKESLIFICNYSGQCKKPVPTSECNCSDVLQLGVQLNCYLYIIIILAKSSDNLIHHCSFSGRIHGGKS